MRALFLFVYLKRSRNSLRCLHRNNEQSNGQPMQSKRGDRLLWQGVFAISAHHQEMGAAFFSLAKVYTTAHHLSPQEKDAENRLYFHPVLPEDTFPPPHAVDLR